MKLFASIFKQALCGYRMKKIHCVQIELKERELCGKLLSNEHLRVGLIMPILIVWQAG